MQKAALDTLQGLIDLTKAQQKAVATANLRLVESLDVKARNNLR
ncbi:MAG TPA: hypothetical protein VGM43_21780 [Bryobacteraceae bacterium]|jgi:hypothetical protein